MRGGTSKGVDAREADPPVETAAPRIMEGAVYVP
jgi:hypothetical protein